LEALLHLLWVIQETLVVRVVRVSPVQEIQAAVAAVLVAHLVRVGLEETQALLRVQTEVAAVAVL
jgi:hypothetical protein